MLQGIGSDFRHVVRGLRRSPGFTAVAVVSLAIGIGANTAMFGVVRTLLLTPIAVEAPDELALVTWRRDGDFSIGQTGSTSYPDPAGGPELRSNFSHPIYRALRDATPPGVDLFAFAFLRSVSVARGDAPALATGGALVDGSYFSALRPRMAAGRPIGPDDDRPGSPLVAVLGHAFWMRAFGGDPAIVGSTVRVNGVPAEVVGVTAEGFEGMSQGGFFPQTGISVPMSAQPVVYARMGESMFASESVFWVRVMARVPPDVSRPAVEQALGAAMVAHPSPLVGEDGHVPVLRLIDGSRGAQPVRPANAAHLWLLGGVVAAVLLVACVNLANLMLARGLGRRREVAVRRALGGGRVRLARQMLLEGLVLTVLGAAAGLLLTLASRGLLGRLLAGTLGVGAWADAELGVALDTVVLGVSGALCVGSTLLFGLLPAMRLSDVDPLAWLADRSAAGAPRATVGRVLVALQIAVSVPLVIGAALFLRTVANLDAVELGFDPDGLVTFQLDPGFTGLPEEAWPGMYVRLVEELRDVPGVRSATLVENALMSGIVSNGGVEVDGESHRMYWNAVGPGFIETLGMRLEAGRMPGVQDGPGAPDVGVVNTTAVREVFGGASPIGKVVRMGGRDVRVVGVVGDTPYRSQRDPVPPTIYDAALQRQGYGGHHLVLRTDVAAARLEPAVREAVSRIDPDLPVPALRSQTDLIAATSARERVLARLLSVFGAFALVLASVGLYGVTAYGVARRTAELGVRLAVGARPGQVTWMVLRQVVALAAAGLVLGVPGALLASRVATGLLFGVEPTDAVTVVAAGVVMMGVAVGAGLVPAVRAARMDVLKALAAD